MIRNVRDGSNTEGRNGSDMEGKGIVVIRKEGDGNETEEGDGSDTEGRGW